MTSMFRNLVAPAVAVMVLGLASAANAAFTVQTSIVSVNGQAFNDTPGGAGATYTTGTSTIVFGDSTVTGNAVAYPSESVTLTGAYNGTASSTAITVVELITVTNNGATGTFTETTQYSLTADGLGRITGGVTVTPASILVGNNIFTASMAQATSTGYNQTSANAAISAQINISAVPEPASVLMLGLGLVGTVGVAARRRLARA